jgi:hypothetical protein
MCYVSIHHELICNWQFHNLISELFQFLSMQWFCHIISDHAVTWTQFNLNVTLFLLIIYEKISDNKVAGSLACTLSSIIFLENCTLVVLQNKTLSISISLCFQDSFGPQYGSNYIIHCCYFCSR